jgi:hypothetical protein
LRHPDNDVFMLRCAPRLKRLTLSVLLLSVSVAGCHRLKSTQPAPEPPKTLVHVTNGEFLDAVVYVVDRGQRVRLGVATSNRTTTFELPSHLVFSPTPLSFLVDPIGGRVHPSTGDIVIDPGDNLELRLSGGRVVLTKRVP